MSSRPKGGYVTVSTDDRGHVRHFDLRGIVAYTEKPHAREDLGKRSLHFGRDDGWSR